LPEEEAEEENIEAGSQKPEEEAEEEKGEGRKEEEGEGGRQKAESKMEEDNTRRGNPRGCPKPEDIEKKQDAEARNQKAEEKKTVAPKTSVEDEEWEQLTLF
jgi:hypothetical protein